MGLASRQSVAGVQPVDADVMGRFYDRLSTASCGTLSICSAEGLKVSE